MDIKKQKHIKALVMVFIIICSILTLGFKYYMDDAALSVDRPSFIKTTLDNQVAILFGNSIYITKGHQKWGTVLNFDQIGLSLIGDFDFFSNGDLLVYSHKQEQTLLQSLKQYARLQETREGSPTGDNGFYRCQVKAQRCQKFTNNLPAFYTSFRLAIDRQSDDVYIADTPKFVLYKSDRNGELLAQNSTNLHFPNQLFLYDNVLYIANTNKHSIKIVHKNTLKFGEEIKNHKTVIDVENSWPSDFIKTPHGWWVNIAGSNMSNSRIQIFDNDWKKLNTIQPSSEDSDIWGMTLFNKQVLVTDWLNIKILRFDLAGRQLSDFSYADLDLAIQKSIQLKTSYTNTSSYALYAFFFVFGFGVIAAFVLEKEQSLTFFRGPRFKKEESKIDDIGINNMLMPPGKDIYWIETKQRKYRKFWLALLLICIPLSIYPFFQIYPKENIFHWNLVFIALSVIAFICLVSWVLYRSLSVKIGISGYLLIIDEGNGTVGIGKDDAIQYNQNIIIIGKAVAVLGPPNSPIFAKDEFKKWVEPRIQKGQAINHWVSFKILWALKHPSVIMNVTVLSTMILIILFRFL